MVSITNQEHKFMHPSKFSRIQGLERPSIPFPPRSTLTALPFLLCLGAAVPSLVARLFGALLGPEPGTGSLGSSYSTPLTEKLAMRFQFLIYDTSSPRVRRKERPARIRQDGKSGDGRTDGRTVDGGRRGHLQVERKPLDQMKNIATIFFLR